MNCMNCGAMLLSGATVCPVCQQPTNQAQGNSSWQPPSPVNPPGAPWQQPGGQFQIGPPPLASGSTGPNVALVLVIVLAVIFVIGGAAAAIFVLQGKRSSRYDTDNYNRSRATPTPYVYNTPPPTPPNNRSGAPISGGVLNGKAIELPQPVYPAIAKAAKASGSVVVQVTVDESGNVTSARAISGHSLLQASAVQAARQARFSPTIISGKPVKVTGTLSYNFAAE